jgi:hypothetical protein
MGWDTSRNSSCQTIICSSSMITSSTTFTFVQLIRLEYMQFRNLELITLSSVLLMLIRNSFMSIYSYDDFCCSIPLFLALLYFLCVYYLRTVLFYNFTIFLCMFIYASFLNASVPYTKVCIFEWLHDNGWEGM